MHHGTCVTHVPWCMSGSLTCGDGENVPGIPGACAPAILRICEEAHYDKYGTIKHPTNEHFHIEIPELKLGSAVPIVKIIERVPFWHLILVLWPMISKINWLGNVSLPRCVKFENNLTRPYSVIAVTALYGEWRATLIWKLNFPHPFIPFYHGKYD